MSLIDREALLEFGKVIPMTKVFADWDELDRNTKIAVLKYAQYVKRLISNAPAVDAVEVVRCEKCKHTKTDGCENPAIYCEKWDRWEMPSDFFCADGERRDNE